MHLRLSRKVSVGTKFFSAARRYWRLDSILAPSQLRNQTNAPVIRLAKHWVQRRYLSKDTMSQRNTYSEITDTEILRKAMTSMLTTQTIQENCDNANVYDRSIISEVRKLAYGSSWWSLHFNASLAKQDPIIALSAVLKGTLRATDGKDSFEFVS